MDADTRYVMEHHERWVERRSGRKPNGRPVLLWPNGRVRIEFGGNFPSMKDAADRIRKDLDDGR